METAGTDDEASPDVCDEACSDGECKHHPARARWRSKVQSRNGPPPGSSLWAGKILIVFGSCQRGGRGDMEEEGGMKQNRRFCINTPAR